MSQSAEPESILAEVEEALSVALDLRRLKSANELHTLRSRFANLAESETNDCIKAALIVFDCDLHPPAPPNSDLFGLLNHALETFRMHSMQMCAAFVEVRIGEWYYQCSDYESALETYSRAFQQIANGKRTIRKAHILENIGIVYFRLGQYEQSQKAYEQSIQEWLKVENTESVARVQVNLANLFAQRGDDEAAEKLYIEALRGFEEAHESLFAASTRTNLGIHYTAHANYSDALRCLHSAIDVFQEANHNRGLAAAYGAMGDVYEATGDHQRAMDWYIRALHCAEHIGRKSAIAEKHVQIGQSLVELRRIAEAIDHLTLAVDICKQTGSLPDMSVALAYLAMAELENSNIVAARENINMALHLATTAGAQSKMVTYQLIDAQVYIAEGRLELALEKLNYVVEQSARQHFDKQLSEAHRFRAVIFERLGRYEQAYEELQQHLKENEKILGIQKQRDLSLLEAEMQIRERQREHDRAMEEERRLREQQRSLLVNMVPTSIADRLMAGEQMIAEGFAEVSIVFLDLVNFTKLASLISPDHVLQLLNQTFRKCDDVVARYGLTKIKTIGDSYMAIAGAPVEQPDNVLRMTSAVLELHSMLATLEIHMPQELGDTSWTQDFNELEVRIGVHCGRVSAGVIGEVRMAYDVWGDAVNVAARLEQTGIPGRIHVSDHFHSRVLELDAQRAKFELRGEIQVKGKGLMNTWWMSAP